MARYVVYVDVDLVRKGTLPSITTTFARIGFERAMRQEQENVPLASLLFIGASAYDEIQLARHLEELLRWDTMCDVHVIVFDLAILCPRPAPQQAQAQTLYQI